MVDIVILGTVALDDLKTPFGERKNALGGSATYASYAASFFAKPGIISVIGTDFPEKHIDLLKSRNINLDGIKKEGKTFHWTGYYEFDMNEAKTLKTELGSLEHYKPSIPEEYKKAKYLFLGNIDPVIQLEVLKQFNKPFTIMDTMNLWITIKRDDVLTVMKEVDMVVMNDGEARMLFQTPNLIQAANKILALGPKSAIIKKGEHGAMLFMDNKHFNAPGYPLENVQDPTGCGDCFGGGLIGFLAKTQDHTEKNIRKAVVYGSAIASFNAEGFSLENLQKITHADIEKRFAEFKNIREF